MHGGAAARLRRPAPISAFIASAIAADSTGRTRFDEIADAGAMDGNMPVRNRAVVTGSGIGVVMVLECSDPDSKAMEIAVDSDPHQKRSIHASVNTRPCGFSNAVRIMILAALA